MPIIRRLQHVAHTTSFKAGPVVWCGAVGYAFVLRDAAAAAASNIPQPADIAYSPTPDHRTSLKRSGMCHML